MGISPTSLSLARTYCQPPLHYTINYASFLYFCFPPIRVALHPPHHWKGDSDSDSWVLTLLCYPFSPRKPDDTEDYHPAH